MNDPLDDMAAELARLQPTETSERLNRRLEQEVGLPNAVESPVEAPPWWFRWAPWAAAAALVPVVAVLMSSKVKSPNRHPAGPPVSGVTGAVPQPLGPSTPGPDFRRVRQAHYLVDAEDNGLVYTSSATPWRKVRWQYVSASEWRDDRDKTTFQVLIPREETMLIPVNIQ